MSAFPPQADIGLRARNVRYWHLADMRSSAHEELRIVMMTFIAGSVFLRVPFSTPFDATSTG